MENRDNNFYENYWTLIFNSHNKIIGYTPTYKEADMICIKHPDYSWDYAKNIYKSPEKRYIIFKKLNMITIHD
tara:strand:+ start:568 stop:786 length:219 start_codon:yes stop_codon:yes gene_type:complete